MVPEGRDLDADDAHHSISREDSW